jgi:hypothetical protein
MSTIVSTCSMSTGHSCMHAPHVVQAHRTSSSITSGTRGTGSGSAPAALPSKIWGPCSNRWSRRFMTRSLGESGLPVFHAGHAL